MYCVSVSDSTEILQPDSCFVLNDRWKEKENYCNTERSFFCRFGKLKFWKNSILIINMESLIVLIIYHILSTKYSNSVYVIKSLFSSLHCFILFRIPGVTSYIEWRLVWHMPFTCRFSVLTLKVIKLNKNCKTYFQEKVGHLWHSFFWNWSIDTVDFSLELRLKKKPILMYVR